MITATFIGQDEQLRNYVRTCDFLDFLKECMSTRPKGEKYRFMLGGATVNWSTPFVVDSVDGPFLHMGRGNFDIDLSRKKKLIFTSQARNIAISFLCHRFRTCTLRVFFTDKRRSKKVGRIWSFYVWNQGESRIPRVRVIGKAENTAASMYSKHGDYIGPESGIIYM